MKKKVMYLLGAAALLLTACSHDEVTNPSENDGNFRVTVRLPEKAFGTRALSDGKTADKLLFAVYDATNSNALVFEGEANFNGALETTVTMNLSNGKNYNIAFFAQSSASEEAGVYHFDADNKEFTVSYANMTSAGNLNDDYDCFYKLHTTGVIGQVASSQNVTLTRPVAQLNWGTNDLLPDAANSNQVVIETFGTNGAYIVTNLSTEAYTAFDFLTSDVKGEPTKIAINNLAAPATQNWAFPVDPATFKYVAMQYVLAPATSSLYDLTLSISNSGNGSQTSPTTDYVAVSSAPVQANYRTNIYGTLLSNNITFNINKDPNWNTPDYDVPLTWDGTSVTIPAVDETTKTITVAAPSDLAGLAALVNGTNGHTANAYADYTVELENDFDMGGQEFPGISKATRSSSNANGTSFQGTFDGNGHTISNLVIQGSGVANEAPAFIGNLDGEDAVLKDVVFDNIIINAEGSEQAGVVGLLTNGATVSGVTVKSGKISSTEGAGIVGRLIKSGTVSECKNYASVTVSHSNAGGIVGAAYYTSADGEMEITNCQNYGSVTGTGSNAVAIGGIAGLCCATVSGCENNGTITGAQNSTGGIVGAQQNAGYIRNCVNNGAVSSVNTTLGTGGIVGWVKYLNDATNYPVQNIIEVTGCTNNASVSGGSATGGIVGEWYQCGVCDGNKNYAAKLNATTGFVAGIVGTSQFIGDYPSKVEAGQPLKVTNNVSTTTLEDMTGTMKALIVYINSPANTITSGNDPEQER